MTHGKQKKASAIDMSALQKDAVSMLAKYESWAKAASDSQRVTPIQFLAVVLWAAESLQGRELTDQEQVVVLSAWWKKLVDATARRVATLGGLAASRYVVPHDTLTLLELDALKVSTLDGWCMSTLNADSWLEAMGFGAWCKGFFEACGYGVTTAMVTPFRVVVDGIEPPVNWSQLVAFRREHADTEWTPAQKGIAAEEARTRKKAPGAKRVAAAMATELGVSVSRFNELIRTAKEAGKRLVDRTQSA